MSAEDHVDGGSAPVSNNPSALQAQTEGQTHDSEEIGGVQAQAQERSQVESGGDGPNHGGTSPDSAENLRHPPPHSTDSPQAHAHEDRSALEGFVQPSSYLRRPRGLSRPMPPNRPPETAVDREQRRGLQIIRAFLKVRTSYDVTPLSFRLIVFDTALLVKKSLSILIQNGIVSAPLWDSKLSTFAGLLTTSDYINVIQYYWQHPEEMNRIDQFRLDSLRDIERAIGVASIETVSIHPLRPLYEACRRMIASRARRLPLIDTDDDTKRAMVVSVLTQYRILKFIAVNVTETRLLRKPLRELNIGTFTNLQTASIDTPVIEVIHKLVHNSISSVPILNTDRVVINVFEAVDVITLIKNSVYDELALSVGEALQKRPADFPGIYTCSLDDRLDTILDTIRKSRVHRFIIVDEQLQLQGILSLSDILEHLLLEGESEDQSTKVLSSP